MNSLMTNLDVEQARSTAAHLSNYLTSYTVKVIPALWAKVYPTPEPVPKTAWECFMVTVHKPVAIPTYLFYLMIFVLSLDILSGLRNVWETYGTAIMESISQFKLLEIFLGRCDSIATAVRNAVGVVWRLMANTAIHGSHKMWNTIGELRSSIQVGLLKAKAYNIKTVDVAIDVDKGSMIQLQAITND